MKTKTLNKKEWDSLRKVLNAIEDCRYEGYKVKISNTNHNNNTKVAVTMYNYDNKIIKKYLIPDIYLKIDNTLQIIFNKEIDINYSKDINFIFYSLLTGEEYRLSIREDKKEIKLLN